MRIVFFGTPPFAAEILKALLREEWTIAGVVTAPDRPRGRSGKPAPSAVKQVALEAGLSVHQPVKASSEESAQSLADFQADLFVVVAYGQILRENLLTMAPLGCINVHASLLPAYRGAAPIQTSILNGDVETGVTIMHMVRALDAGDMIRVSKVPIGPNTTAGELEELLCEASQPCLIQAIRDLQSGTATRTPQDEELVTYAGKLHPNDGEIDWSQSAQEVHNRIRAMTPRPGASCQIEIRGKRKRVKLLKSQLVQTSAEPAGVFLEIEEPRLIVSCGHGAVEILSLQVEGKKAVSTVEFLRGISKKELSLL